jgi:hypothetical protein
MQKLFNLGARRFVLMSVNPLGCSPSVMLNQQISRNGCVQGLNRAAHLFNTHLKSLVDVLKSEMPGSTFVYVNSYKIIRDIIRNPISKGKYHFFYIYIYMRISI